MSDTNLTPSPDEVPAVDIDDELGLGSDASVTDFGEEPDVETRSDEAPAAIDPSI
jgi:hypothetical protein